MATTQDIVTRALQKCRVTPIGEAPAADEATHALDALNMMLHSWKTRGVDLAYTDLALTDVFPLANEFHEGTVYMLAGRISTDYEAPRDFDADDWFRAIQAAYMIIAEVTMPSGLIDLSSRRNSSGTLS